MDQKKNISDDSSLFQSEYQEESDSSSIDTDNNAIDNLYEYYSPVNKDLFDILI